MNAVRPHFQQAWYNAANVARVHDAADAATSRATREWTAGPLEAQYGLSPREAEVLIWVAQGKTNGEAAMILGIRPNTVRTHLERVFLNSASRLATRPACAQSKCSDCPTAEEKFRKRSGARFRLAQ